MSAIQADRERDLERTSREHRLLETDRMDADRPASSASVATIRPARPAARSERSNGPACEAV
ncbi:MAG TPA: hypothetical protein VH440_05415 [Candidatus Limnocylindrales bacterium]